MDEQKLQEKIYHLAFTASQVDELLQLLGELPHKQSNGFIVGLVEACKSQQAQQPPLIQPG